MNMHAKANAENRGIKDTSSNKKSALWGNGFNGRLLKQFQNKYIEDL